MAGSVTIQGLLTGTTSGTQYIGPFTIPNAASTGNFQVTEFSIISGVNTVAVPNWAVVGIIVPPATNTFALTLKGASGDTGIGVAQNQPSLIAMPTNGAPNPANFILVSAGSVTGLSAAIFF